MAMARMKIHLRRTLTHPHRPQSVTTILHPSPTPIANFAPSNPFHPHLINPPDSSSLFLQPHCNRVSPSTTMGFPFSTSKHWLPLKFRLSLPFGFPF
ncbi:hypothetical protein SLEP1_g12532 [Rubroshorea leprosula]|uniref:Uncharacterized protein n=1 Tax=Rubroshorea leprosula TaxID=152421 RepID=A0AAV5IIN7_9ROSI|nr:hypothetical protein SLEP1_g12532 [Rubroshorea leprosula]